MITVKPCGFLSRALGKVVEMGDELVTVERLLATLQDRMPPNDEPPLSRANTLIAVNGVEISALNGEETRLSHGDVVTLIPVSHGG